MATTVFAIPASREFIIQKFSNHSEYNVLDIKNAEEVESLQLNYIPEGFVKTEDYEHAVVYSNGELTFFVEKVELTSSIRFDTEKYDNESISINGVEAAYFKSDNKEGIIFNNGKYIFIITGNIKKEEFVKIAQNIE